jgi:hypothetical protein
MAIAMRTDVEIYMDTSATTTPTWTRCGDGWKKFAENPNAQTESVKYINQSSETTDTTSYSPQYSFECDLMYTDSTIKKVYDIAKNRETGSNAVVTILVVDKFDPGVSTGTYVARKETLAVAVTSLDGEKKMAMSGNLNGQGDGVKGVFTPASGETPASFVADA